MLDLCSSSLMISFSLMLLNTTYESMFYDLHTPISIAYLKFLLANLLEISHQHGLKRILSDPLKKGLY